MLGPRQTGKRTLIRSLLSPAKFWSINLLLSDQYVKYSKAPEQFRLEAASKITEEKIDCVFIDEIQRVPALLNEIHHLIETYPKCQFIMTGSSARKIKRGTANLLAGRAVQRHLHPLLYQELRGKNFQLEDRLVFGTLPALEGRTMHGARIF